MTRLSPLAAAILLLSSLPALGQHHDGHHDGQHVMGGDIQSHAILEQFEARMGASPNAFRWHGQAWIGTDVHKLWLRSEGAVLGNGTIEDGRQELLYTRAISTYFDLQAGWRIDLDSGTTRNWAALGVRGLLPWFIETEATVYASDAGHYAARVAVSHDIRLTRQLVLQPQAEANLYSKADPGRHLGAGLSGVDAGLRLRYEWTPQFAPYVGVVYGARIGQSARMADEPATQIRFVFGVRTWF